MISTDALAQLRALPAPYRRNIGYRLNLLQSDLQGDIAKLSGTEAKYRLRVGPFRVLFKLQDDLISVYAVKDRKQAYE